MLNLEIIELNDTDIEKIFNSLSNFFGTNPFNEIEIFSLRLLKLVKVKYIYFSGLLHNDMNIYFTFNEKIYLHKLNDFDYTKVQWYKIQKFNIQVPTITNYILEIYANRNFKNFVKVQSEINLKQFRKKQNEKANCNVLQDTSGSIV